MLTEDIDWSSMQRRLIQDYTHGWRSLTFFCALLGLPSSSELFTLDLVLAIFFSFCLASAECPNNKASDQVQILFK